MFDYAARVKRLRAEMESRGIDAVLLSVGADLPYLTGYTATPMERLTMGVVPRVGPVTIVVPALEAPRVALQGDLFNVVPWDELEDPVGIVVDLLAGAVDGPLGTTPAAAIGDHTWSRFLLLLQARLPQVKFVPATPVTAPLRVRKDAEEVGALRAAAANADRVAGRLADLTFSGRTERELARWVGAALLEEGCEFAAFTIVASGPNGASPHHEPGDRVIGAGDTVVVDFGGPVHGYASDTTRTFSVGEPSAEVAGAYAVLKSAQAAGVGAVRPGVAAEHIDDVTRTVIDGSEFADYFIHRTGHGIGLEVHEDPYIVSGNSTALEPGMAFSVEPGIYIPGRFGMRIEDIVVVTDGGGELLNNSSHDLVVVG